MERTDGHTLKHVDLTGPKVAAGKNLDTIYMASKGIWVAVRLLLLSERRAWHLGSTIFQHSLLQNYGISVVMFSKITPVQKPGHLMSTLFQTISC